MKKFFIILSILTSIKTNSQKLQSVHGHEILNYVYIGATGIIHPEYYGYGYEVFLGGKIGNCNAELFGGGISSTQYPFITDYGLRLGYQISHFKPYLTFGEQSIGQEREAALKGTKNEFQEGFKIGGGINYYFESLPILFGVEQFGKFTNFKTGIYLTF